MTSGTYRGVVRAGIIQLLETEPMLAEGTEVLVTPVIATPGTAAAVLAALEAAPHVLCEWVDELERVMAAGQRPPTHQDPFTEDRADREED